MGNTESNVTSAVKNQAGVSTQTLYKFVNLKGGGLLVDMMKRACQTKQFAEIDHAIKTKVEPFLYNKGAGRYFPISKLVLLRNKERARTKQLPEIRALENPDEDFNIHDYCTEVSEAEYVSNPSAYRFVCWNLNVSSKFLNILSSLACVNNLTCFVGTRRCRRNHFASLSTKCLITACGSRQTSA